MLTGWGGDRMEGWKNKGAGVLRHRLYEWSTWEPYARCLNGLVDLRGPNVASHALITLISRASWWAEARATQPNGLLLWFRRPRGNVAMG